MARRFRGRRIILLAAIVVALSIGIVFASIPKVPKPHGSLQGPESHTVKGGTSTSPGVFALLLQNIPNSNSFSVGVSVIGGNGNATFCVIDFNTYLGWALNNQTEQYPYSSCILLHQNVSQDTLSFTPTFTGDWDVVAINTYPVAITVDFYPA